MSMPICWKTSNVQLVDDTKFHFRTFPRITCSFIRSGQPFERVSSSSISLVHIHMYPSSSSTPLIVSANHANDNLHGDITTFADLVNTDKVIDASAIGDVGQLSTAGNPEQDEIQIEDVNIEDDIIPDDNNIDDAVDDEVQGVIIHVPTSLLLKDVWRNRNTLAATFLLRGKNLLSHDNFEKVCFLLCAKESESVEHMYPPYTTLWRSAFLNVLQLSSVGKSHHRRRYKRDCGKRESNQKVEGPWRIVKIIHCVTFVMGET